MKQEKNLLFGKASKLCVVFLMLIISSTSFGQKSKIVEDELPGSYFRIGNQVTYKWKHKSKNGQYADYVITLEFIRGWEYMQDIYEELNHEHGNYNRFIKSDPFKNDLLVLTRELRKLAKESGVCEVRLALSFVQAFPYQTEMGGYQRYAVETLVDASGDCSDTSVLFAGILAAWGYDCIFLDLPNHLAVGVWSVDIPGGVYFVYRGRKFYYCETTGTGWDIGFGGDDYEETEGVENVSF